MYEKAGPQYLEELIEMVGRVKNKELTQKVIDIVINSETGDPIYIYKIKIMSGKFKEAQKVAVTIAGDY